MELPARTTAAWRPGSVPGNLADSQAVLLFGPDQGGVFEFALSLARISATHERMAAKTADYAAVESSLSSASLFGGASAVLLDEASDAQLNRIAPLLERPFATGARLIVTAGDLKKNSKLRKLFAGSDTAVAAPLYLMQPREIIAVAQGIFRDYGLRLSTSARSCLATYLSGDRALTARACETLALHALGRGSPEVEARDVTAILDAIDEDDLAAPLDHALLSDPVSALRILHMRLASGESFVKLLRLFSMRAFRLRAMLETGLPPRNAVAKARPPVFWASKDLHIRLLEALTPARLDRIIDMIDRAEHDIIENGLRQDARLGALLFEIAQHRSWKES